MRAFALAAVLVCVAQALETGSGQPATAENVVGLTVRTPHFGFNRLLVSLTVCAPGTTECATVDDVMIDTGSTGLRLERSALPPTFRLPPMVGPNRQPLAECLRFVHDSAWGDLFKADLHLGKMTAADLPIQIIDSGIEHRSGRCPVSTTPATSNGTLGIGPQLTDCPDLCQQSTRDPLYFTCGASSCVALEGTINPRYRLPNPVSFFAKHNNGIVLDLPAVPIGGSKNDTGTLTFGVGTAENNQLGQARMLKLDQAGHFMSIYNGHSYPDSYIDSGTETYIIPDDGLARCRDMSWAFCVVPERRLTAIMVGRNGTPIQIAIQVGDYEDIQRHHFGASGSTAVAAPQAARAFVWGAPFFLGKRVFVVMDGKSVPGADGVVGPSYGLQ